MEASRSINFMAPSPSFHRRSRTAYVYNGCLAWYCLLRGSTQPWYTRTVNRRKC